MPRWITLILSEKCGYLLISHFLTVWLIAIILVIFIKYDSTILVVPSLYEDAWADVATEAMALGRPVLVNEIGGLREQIIDSFNGYYCNCNDVVSFEKRYLNLEG
jgi:glycosyltransferase involved in cell wall biosynthesis